MLIKTALVSHYNSDTFLVEMSKAIRSFQEEGLTVEIQYQPLAVNSPRPAVLFSALVHGRKENTNG